jgi:hypothetical protein
MPAVKGRCAFCGQPVTAIETAAFRVTGWAAERGGGGANAIIGRERLEGIAHAVCAKQAADKARRGIADGQGSLL